jgi:exopolysaccharide production protein ExoQ
LKEHFVQKVERVVVFILLLLASGAGQSFFGDPTRNTTAAGEAGLQIAFGLLYLILLAPLTLRLRGTALEAIKRDKWTALLCLWAIASSLWSADAAESFRRGLGLAGTSMAGLYIGLRYGPKQQLRIIASVIGVGAVASLLVCLLLPGIGLNPFGCWVGVYLIKNTMGRVMALGALCFVLLALSERRRRVVRFAFFLFCCVLLVLSQSATGLVVTLLILAMLLPLRKLLYLGPKRLLAAAFVLGPFLAVGTIWAAENWEEIVFALGRSSSLSGRIPLWQLVWGEITQRPVLGYGFTAFWTSWEGQRVSQTVAWDVAVPHAHNSFLEVWLGLGIIGLVMMLINLTRNFGMALRVARGSHGIERSWPLLLLIFTVLYSVTENTLLTVNSLPWLAYTGVSFWLVRYLREEEPSSALQPEPEPALSL